MIVVAKNKSDKPCTQEIYQQEARIGLAWKPIIKQTICDHHATSTFQWDSLANNMAELDQAYIYGNTRCRLCDIFVAQAATIQIHGIGGSGDIEDLLDYFLGFDWNKLKEDNRPLLLFGGFGSGKSSLLKIVASHLHRKYSERAGQFYPIYIPLRELAIHDVTNLNLALMQFLHPYGILNLQALPIPTLFLFDGFDELNLYSGADDRFNIHYDQLCSLLNYTNSHVVIAGRPLYFLGREENIPPDTPIITVEPFNNNQINAWLEKWHKLGDGTKEIPFQDLKIRGLLEVVRTPLILYMTALIYHDELREAKIYSRGEVYKHFFDHTQRGKYHKETPAHRIPKNYRDILQNIAIVIKQHGRNQEVIAWNKLSQYIQEFQEETLQSDFFEIRNITLAAHFFSTRMLENKRHVEFVHKSFREYLVAEKIVGFLVTNSHNKTKFDWIGWYALGRLFPSQEEISFVEDLLGELTIKQLHDIHDSISKCTFPLTGSGHFKTLLNGLPPIAEVNAAHYRSINLAGLAYLVRHKIFIILKAKMLTGEIRQENLKRRASSVPLTYLYHLFHSTPGTHKGAYRAHWETIVHNIKDPYVFTGEILGVNLKGLALSTGKLNAQLVRSDLTASLLSNLEITASKIRMCDCEGLEIVGCNITDTVFSSVNLGEAECIASIYNKCIFRGIAMCNMRFERVTFIDCIFENCRLCGTIIESGSFTSVEFNYNNFEGARINTSFHDCTFTDNSWQNISIDSNTLFSNCKGKFPSQT